MPDRPAPDKPTAEEYRIVELLVAGTTDEQAAKQLGCSQRTLRRRLRALMHKLGARSRFQAGYLVARAGWLEDPDAAEH